MSNIASAAGWGGEFITAFLADLVARGIFGHESGGKEAADASPRTQIAQALGAGLRARFMPSATKDDEAGFSQVLSIMSGPDRDIIVKFMNALPDDKSRESFRATTILFGKDAAERAGVLKLFAEKDPAERDMLIKVTGVAKKGMIDTALDMLKVHHPHILTLIHTKRGEASATLQSLTAWIKSL